jgi:hypothetical protein
VVAKIRERLAVNKQGSHKISYGDVQSKEVKRNRSEREVTDRGLKWVCSCGIF